jgi:hypothetical protein
MSILKTLLPRWDEPYEPPVQKTYEELYGEQLRRKIAELRAAGKYLPEMKKPHWNRRNI